MRLTIELPNIRHLKKEINKAVTMLITKITLKLLL
jgi:hypothetical protein